MLFKQGILNAVPTFVPPQADFPLVLLIKVAFGVRQSDDIADMAGHLSGRRKKVPHSVTKGTNLSRSATLRTIPAARSEGSTMPM
jgi:hypothetical protein